MRKEVAKIADIGGFNIPFTAPSTETALNIVSTTGTVLWVLLMMAVVTGVLIWIVYLLKFKHKFRIKVITGGKKFIIDDRARVVLKGGSPFCWQLMKRRHKIPIPPSEAIEMTSKGKMCVEAYYTEEGEYLYTKDIIDELGIKERGFQIDYIIDKPSPVSFFSFSKFKKPKGKYIFITDKKKSEAIKALEPITSSDRAFYMAQVKQAADFGGKAPLWEKILQFAPTLAVVFFMILLIVFAGDLASAWTKIGSAQIQMQKELTNTVKAMNKVQVIGGESDIEKPPD